MKNVRQSPLPALLVALARPVPRWARPRRFSLVVASTDAIQRGVPTEALRSLPRDRPRSPVALVVLAELMEMARWRTRQSMDQRMQDGRMLDIPARVRRLIRDGVPPHEVMDQVRRAMQRDRGRHYGPALPVSDRPISDGRLRDGIRRIGCPSMRALQSPV
ncbi:MAG: hypothetical protein OSA81_07180 [Longimicrobiales bacterium]|nr:hypothetical protein [Longimicrobiales bacterium]